MSEDAQRAARRRLHAGPVTRLALEQAIDSIQCFVLIPCEPHLLAGRRQQVGVGKCCGKLVPLYSRIARGRVRSAIRENAE